MFDRYFLISILQTILGFVCLGVLLWFITFLEGFFEITTKEYQLVLSMKQNCPSLSKDIEECMENNKITCREYDWIKEQHKNKFKHKLLEK